MRNWSLRERGLAAALAISIAAVIVVPAWADSADEAEPPPPPHGAGEVEPAPDPSDAGIAVTDPEEQQELDALGECLRRHGAPLPETRPEDPAALPRLPAEIDGAFHQAAEACGLAEPPPGTDPFPLSDEEIAAERKALEEFVACMRAHGQQLGDPEVERDRIAIALGPGAFSEEFLAAQRECGGPPGSPPS
jgi:hypothetical protein